MACGGASLDGISPHQNIRTRNGEQAFYCTLLVTAYPPLAPHVFCMYYDATPNGPATHEPTKLNRYLAAGNCQTPIRQ